MEERLAPANVVSPTQLTYQDIDGDLVLVTFSRPILTSNATANVFLAFSTGNVDGSNATPQQLWRIDLRGSGAAAAAGTSITFKVGANGGDGFADVGFIDATGKDLGKVTVAGDLGRIHAGDDNFKTPALKALFAQSMGVKGLPTQAPGSDLHSDLHGNVGKIVVTGNIQDADISVLATNSNGFRTGNIGLLNIGGSLVGGGTEKSGHIFTGGSIGGVRIGGSVVGGAGLNSGSMFAEGKLGVIKIGGSLQGAAGGGSGGIACNTGITALSIGGSIIGGNSGTFGSGVVQTYVGKIKRLVVNGSIVGGTGFHSGLVQANSDLVSLTINGSLQGGPSQYSGRVISRFGSIGHVFVGGDITSGIGFESGAIAAGNNLGNVVVQGNILGTATNRVVIEAGGADGTARVGNITVGGHATFADIFAGYGDGFFRDRTNADARIGRVNVGGDWIASNLVAGVDVGPDGLFGTVDDASEVDGSNFVSKIGAITIGGIATGTPGGADHFGIVAELVKALSINGAGVALKPGLVNDFFVALGSTSDFVLTELNA
jgi:hypothetical protein